MALIDQTPPAAGAAPGGDQTAKAQDAISSSESTDAKGGVKIDPAQVRAKMRIPPEFQDAYSRLVQAGAKLLFNPQTHQLVMSHLEGQGPAGPRLGRGIAGLMLRLMRMSKYQAPSQVLVPAGLDLLVQAVDYLSQTGQAKLTPEDVSTAVKVMVATLLVQFGADPAKVKQQIGADGTPDDNAPDDGSMPPDDTGAPPDAGAPPGPAQAAAGMPPEQQ